MKRVIVQGVTLVSLMVGLTLGWAREAVAYTPSHWHVAEGVEVDVLTPSGPPPKGGWGAVLLIPGGGWSTVDTVHAQPIAVALVQRGLLVVTTTYRTAPAAPWPAQLDDVVKVVWQMRAHAHDLHLDPHRVAALGASAGALLAGHLGTRNQTWVSGGDAPIPSQVQRVISIGGPWDLDDALRSFAMHQGKAHAAYPDVSALGMISNLFGGHLPTDFEAQQASPRHWISAQSAPTLFLHGAEDNLVPPTQSEAACRDMVRQRGQCQVVIFPGVGHTVTHDFLQPILDFLGDWLPEASASPPPSSAAIEERRRRLPIQ